MVLLVTNYSLISRKSIGGSNTEKEGEFRTLVIPGFTQVGLKQAAERVDVGKYKQKVSRHLTQPVDQDWTDAWPTAKTFNWSAVPLPLRQGRVYKTHGIGLAPKKYANAELMKIPNFLHLTPGHIKKHSKALKQFCTKWPDNLNTEKIEEVFPVEIVRRYYASVGPTNFDQRSKLVTLSIKMTSLRLDYHARDKIRRLLGEKYNPKTDMIQLSADRCPLRKQNYEYLHYLLTAVYIESCTLHPWENEKDVDDAEFYDFHSQPSKQAIVDYITQAVSLKDEAGENIPSVIKDIKEPIEEQIMEEISVKKVETAIENLFNKGESDDTIQDYKASIRNLLLSEETKKPPPYRETDFTEQLAVN